MSLSINLLERKKEATKLVCYSDVDSGSIQVQVVGLTERILSIAEHVKINKKDFGAKRRLEMLVCKRRRFLQYLKKTSKEMFEKVSQAIIWSK